MNAVSPGKGVQMEDIVKIMLQSGKSALDLAFYVLLPVLVIMIALCYQQALLEMKGRFREGKLLPFPA